MIRVLAIFADGGTPAAFDKALRALSAVTGREPSFHVETAAGLEAGLQRLATGAVDIALLELDARQLDVLWTLATLIDRHPELPVVTIGDADDDELALAAVRAGAHDYVPTEYATPPILSRVIRYACERHRLQNELRRLALADPLTGLQNRRGFLSLAEQLWRVAQRSHRGLILIFIDIDDMKRVNDELGHDEGDRLLVDLARILRLNFRESDVLGRLGGDEFAVLAVDCPPGAVAIMTDRLAERIAERNARPGQRAALSVSVGAATLDVDTMDTVADLLAAADRTMYDHKRSRAGQLPPES